MKKTLHYITAPEVCSQFMDITLENDTVTDVHIEGGCSGNSQGIAALVRGMKTKEVITRLEGICCGKKGASCPDQLAKALREMTK